MNSIPELFYILFGCIEYHNTISACEQLAVCPDNLCFDVIDNTLSVVHLVNRELQANSTLRAQHLCKSRSQLIIFDVVTYDYHISNLGYWLMPFPPMKQR